MQGLNCIPVICRWFGMSSILAGCPKPSFKHKGINFIYSLHCLEHFGKTVNYGPDLQLVVNGHGPLTSVKMHLSVLSEAALQCVYRHK